MARASMNPPMKRKMMGSAFQGAGHHRVASLPLVMPSAGSMTSGKSAVAGIGNA